MAMGEIELGYGTRSLKLAYDDSKYAILSARSQTASFLTDEAIGAALDAPIDSPPLDEIVAAGDSVLIVVSDATRATGSAQVVNLLVRRLIQYGVEPVNVAIIFATGIHRHVTAQEKIDLLSPFIAQRVRTLDHDAYDPNALDQVGVTQSGVPIEVNRALREFSRVIVIGAVRYHYFAGFTGGRKSICPGLASARTIEATHMLALDFHSGGRRAGVGTGLLEGNAVHEECQSVAAIINPAFAINTVVEENGRVVKVFCGHWRSAHRVACEHYLADHSLDIPTQREVVIVSCGGSPYDINLIQAHKALDMAAYACRDSSSIILLAECRDGLGRSDFLKWFSEKNSRALEKRLRDEYEVNGQTAWALLTKAERYKVYLVSDLANDEVRKMRMIPAASLTEALEKVSKDATGYIMPLGAAILPRLGEASSADA
jgi:nickel-dependent lactate racemase